MGDSAAEGHSHARSGIPTLANCQLPKETTEAKVMNSKDTDVPRKGLHGNEMSFIIRVMSLGIDCSLIVHLMSILILGKNTHRYPSYVSLREPLYLPKGPFL